MLGYSIANPTYIGFLIIKKPQTLAVWIKIQSG